MSFRRNSKRALQALTERLLYTECRATGGLTVGCLKPSAGPSVPDVRLSGPPGNPNEPHTGRARAFCGRTGPSLVAGLLSGPALLLSTPQPCVFSGGSGRLGFACCHSSQTRRFPKSPLCLAGTVWKVKLRPPLFYRWGNRGQTGPSGSQSFLLL